MNSATPSSRRIFEPLPSGQAPQWRIGPDWIDLYVLLGVAPDATSAQIEDAILERGADCLSLGLSRGGKPDFVRLIEEHLSEFRPVLLFPANRLRYDDLLKQHRAASDGPNDLPSYQEFLQTLPAPPVAGCLSSLLLLVSCGLAVVAWRAAC